MDRISVWVETSGRWSADLRWRVPWIRHSVPHNLPLMQPTSPLLIDGIPLANWLSAICLHGTNLAAPRLISAAAAAAILYLLKRLTGHYYHFHHGSNFPMMFFNQHTYWTKSYFYVWCVVSPRTEGSWVTEPTGFLYLSQSVLNKIK